MKNESLTSTILMVRPAAFSFNEMAALSNHFMEELPLADATIQQKALLAFDQMTEKLKAAGVKVIIIQDKTEPHTPDSIFPNNWFTTHADSRLVLYPMEVPNRRLERNPETIHWIKDNFNVKEIIDLSDFEAQNSYLEGTGSLVLDRTNKVAYAALSSRTNLSILKKWVEYFPKYKVFSFDATDRNNLPIYHTNVMMCMGDRFVVICFESIKNQSQKDELIQTFKETKKEVIEISFDQMEHFAGNMLQVCSASGEVLLVLSKQAFDSLTNIQISKLEVYNKLIVCDISIIETTAGGSARCMMAEIYFENT